MNNVILLIAVLVCPVTMGTMMFLMMRGNKANMHAKKDDDASGRSDGNN